MQYSIIIVNAVNNEVPHDALQYSILWMQWTMKYHMVHCSTLYCECSEQWSTTWCTAVEYVNAAWTVKYHMMDCSTLYCECSLSSEVPHDALQYCILWLQSEQWSTIRYNAVLCDCSLNNEAPQNTMQHAMNALQYSVTAVWTIKHRRIQCSTLWMHCSTISLPSDRHSQPYDWGVEHGAHSVHWLTAFVLRDYPALLSAHLPSESWSSRNGSSCLFCYSLTSRWHLKSFTVSYRPCDWPEWGGCVSVRDYVSVVMAPQRGWQSSLWLWLLKHSFKSQLSLTACI